MNISLERLNLTIFILVKIYAFIFIQEKEQGEKKIDAIKILKKA